MGKNPDLAIEAMFHEGPWHVLIKVHPRLTCRLVHGEALCFSASGDLPRQVVSRQPAGRQALCRTIRSDSNNWTELPSHNLCRSP